MKPTTFQEREVLNFDGAILINEKISAQFSVMLMNKNNHF